MAQAKRKKKPAPKKPARVPFAELSARRELVLRAIDDVRVILEDADPIGAPEDFAKREKQAFEIFEQINALVPPSKPMSAKERAQIERDLEDKPDDETLRQMLLEMEKMLDDPNIPAEMKAVISREQIHDALASLDEVTLLAPVVVKIQSLVDDLRTPKKRDPKAALLRQEAEKVAAKRRS